MSDARRQPQIPTPVIVRALTVMFLARLGSLSALVQTRPRRFWSRWLGAAMPSADTLGRVATQMEVTGLREVHRQVYARLRRGKALPPPAHGLIAGVVDGHESHATFRRHCTGCLTRTLHTAGGDRTQYYHRHVTFQLVGADWTLLVDAEPQRPGRLLPALHRVRLHSAQPERAALPGVRAGDLTRRGRPSYRHRLADRLLAPAAWAWRRALRRPVPPPRTPGQFALDTFQDVAYPGFVASVQRAQSSGKRDIILILQANTAMRPNSHKNRYCVPVFQQVTCHTRGNAMVRPTLRLIVAAVIMMVTLAAGVWLARRQFRHTKCGSHRG